MESDTTSLQDISQRITKLEKQNRNLKLSIFVILLLIISGGIFSFRFQEEDTNSEIKENTIIEKILKKLGQSIETEKLIIKDTKSKERIEINNNKISFYDVNEKNIAFFDGKAIEIGLENHLVLSSSLFAFYKNNEKGSLPVSTFYPFVPELTFYDQQGSGRFIVNINRFGFYYFDPEVKSSINLNNKGVYYYNAQTKKKSLWP